MAQMADCCKPTACKNNVNYHLDAQQQQRKFKKKCKFKSDNSMFLGDYVIHTAGVVSLEIIVTADTTTDQADDVDTVTLSRRVTRTS